MLALIAYVGGFSAATGMVIVSSIALATMVSNDLVMPVLLRRSGDHQAADVASRVLWIRRLAILLLALMAYSYYRTSSNDAALASYGLMAFAAVAQFAPGLIGGLYWRGASRRGVEVGMLLGFATWLYTPAAGDDHGRLGRCRLGATFGIEWLRPQQLFGMTGWDLTHGTFWSLLVNAATMLVSARWRPGVDERLRAAPFLDPYAERRRWPVAGPATCTWATCWRWPRAWSASAMHGARSSSRHSRWAASCSLRRLRTGRGCSSPNACWPRRLVRPRRACC